MSTDPIRRLVELSSLINDELGEWDEAASRWNHPSLASVSPHDVWQMELLLEALRANQLPNPYLYPKTDGGLAAEWDWNHWSVSVDTGSSGLWAHTVFLGPPPGQDPSPDQQLLLDTEYEMVLPTTTPEELTYALRQFWDKMNSPPILLESHGFHRPPTC